MRTLILATAGLLAAATPQPQRQVIHSGVTFVTTDVVVRNERGQFIADLGKTDFDVYEDGVRQEATETTSTPSPGRGRRPRASASRRWT